MGNTSFVGIVILEADNNGSKVRTCSFLQPVALSLVLLDLGIIFSKPSEYPPRAARLSDKVCAFASRSALDTLVLAGETLVRHIVYLSGLVSGSSFLQNGSQKRIRNTVGLAQTYAAVLLRGACIRCRSSRPTGKTH